MAEVIRAGDESGQAGCSSFVASLGIWVNKGRKQRQVNSRECGSI